MEEAFVLLKGQTAKVHLPIDFTKTKYIIARRARGKSSELRYASTKLHKIEYESHEIQHFWTNTSNV